MRILAVVGARPNFVKIAPLVREIRKHSGLAFTLVHTGQHYAPAMSEQFFADLDIPPPDVNLDVRSGSHAAQTAEIMRRLEPVLLDSSPDLLLVVGDVNSTLASALTAAKLAISVAHVEAGLRSFDRTMPEEINRIVTDALSSLLFVTEESGLRNLLREGVPRNQIHFVGNVMIDALEMLRPRWSTSAIIDRLGLHGRQYAVLTLHRPSNVDRPGTLENLLDAIRRVALRVPVVFPVHPRSREPLRTQADLSWRTSSGEEGIPARGVTCLEPLGYLDFVALMSQAAIVLTDSGGIQEETTVLGVPCLTLRDNTERPITVTHGTNRIVGRDPIRIVEAALRVLAAPPPSRDRPPLWDGSAAPRIVRVLVGQPPVGRAERTASLEIDPAGHAR